MKIIVYEDGESPLETHINNVEDISNFLSTFYEEENIIKQAFHAAYEILKGNKIEKKFFCNGSSGFAIKIED